MKKHDERLKRESKKTYRSTGMDLNLVQYVLLYIRSIEPFEEIVSIPSNIMEPGERLTDILVFHYVYLRDS